MRLSTILGLSESITKPDHLKARLEGVALDKDEEGFYVKTHRGRSDSYASADDIPESAIEWVRSTG